ncbi:unnamed protein product, partial [Rotaria sordida]
PNDGNDVDLLSITGVKQKMNLYVTSLIYIVFTREELLQIDATKIKFNDGYKLIQVKATTNSSDLYDDESNQIFYISNQDSHSITQWIIGDYEPRNIYASIPERPGNSSAQLFYPQGITLDRYGNLYTADSMNSRIQQMFCSNSVFGITIPGTGQTSNTSNELSYPGDVAFDLDLNLYVSDTFNSRIEKFQRIR